MKRLLLATLLLAPSLLPSLALAQQVPQQPQSPREQALTAKLIGEINNNLECSTNVVTLQQKIAQLEAQLKAKDAPAAKKEDRLPEKKKP